MVNSIIPGSGKRSIVALVLILSIPSSCSDRPKPETVENRLSLSRSPYLREHADNPVDWYEWGPEALRKAREDNKPLLISIGYASCHWCHVMEEETFMDTAVARLMNENFIAIKVDREERPDLDQIYIEAAQLTSGSAGWPLNAFALPDGKPFYAATYFPKEEWIKVIGSLSSAFRNEHRKIVGQANAVARGIQSAAIAPVLERNPKPINADLYAATYKNMLNFLDVEKGGLKGAPKFPLPVNWEFLLQYHEFTGDESSMDLLTNTLDRLAMSGLYDQLGGGFARYSTDESWRVPHFEKMLYDNAQLVSLYAHAYQETKETRYEVIVRETLSFVERELTSPEGGFYSSINADSDGEEGKYYTWTKEEWEEALPGDEGQMLAGYFQLSDSGNWEDGRNILYPSGTLQEFAARQRKEGVATALTAGKEVLFRARRERIEPTTDIKILSSWNALMVKGYVDAYVALGESVYLDRAIRNATFLEKKMIDHEGRLRRNYLEGESGIDGFLDDYAFAARAFIQLYQATFEVHWLELARKVTTYAIAHFHDQKSGMFFYTHNEAEQSVFRRIELTDSVIPSSNATMAHVLFCLGVFYDHALYTTMATAMVERMVPEIASKGVYYANWAAVMGLLAFPPYEVAIVGSDARAKNLEMQKKYLPTALFMGGNAENLPLLSQKLVAGRTIIYVCRNKVCRLPVDDPQLALLQLK